MVFTTLIILSLVVWVVPWVANILLLRFLPNSTSLVQQDTATLEISLCGPYLRVTKSTAVSEDASRTLTPTGQAQPIGFGTEDWSYAEEYPEGPTTPSSSRLSA